MAKHARLSASGMHRWQRCPGSILAVEKALASGSIQPKAESTYATEGKVAHALASHCLEGNAPASVYIGTTIDGYRVTDDMAKHVQTYVDYVNAIPGQTWIEQRVDFSRWVPDGFGTSDAIVADLVSNTLHCVDLKFGVGVKVSAYKNEQLMLYALGAVCELAGAFDPTTVILHVHQPRIGNVSTYELDMTELLEFGKYAGEQGRLALTENAPLNPSEKACRFCELKPICPALTKKTEALILSKFDDISLPAVQTLTDDQRAKIILNKSMIVDFMNAVESHVYTELLDGKPSSHFKLVEGRANRTWTEGAAAALFGVLGDAAYDKKIIGLGAAEKKLGAKFVTDNTTKPAGRLTLVGIDDPRENNATKTLDLFDVLD